MLELLPITGFVLAGGRSSRMGRDKALLELDGRTLTEIAIGKLREFCAEVAVAGSREDLSGLARVVPDLRPGLGPAAAVEAGLSASTQPWALFVPVDAPIVPVELLQQWAELVLRTEAKGSYLSVVGQVQPAFILLRKELGARIGEMVGAGELRLLRLWLRLDVMLGPGSLLAVEAETLPCTRGWTSTEVANVFANINTPEDWNSLATRLGQQNQ
ncbi:molybdenum cofactor guanylyltransferase [Bryocella elongata]|uniref:Probable molybdenum cofactor guanylyltransferase n=1 Tax=Bryocella elongata TaxID=863522 RepID=A0A1H5T1L9_9BACT|nr:molybdenum cofactor guanylyltransferase [Bryocella elongata]SEF56782.1 molybdenum cofactor guanylyltransferase [Bryocella elongata]